MLARRIFLAGIAAGLAAGLFVTVLQAVKIAPLIAAAEIYEKAAAGHATSDGAQAGHVHAAAPANAAAQEWEPAAGVERLGYTLLANILVGIGFGLFLSAGMALRDVYSGTPASATSGLAWGIAGFAAFQLAPSFGLPPELPGSLAAGLAARQEWWLATALATAGGLALLAFARGAVWKILGLAVIAAPHLVGAPGAPPGGGSVPPELAARFVAASLGTAALFWLFLGGLGGWLYERLGRA